MLTQLDIFYGFKVFGIMANNYDNALIFCINVSVLSTAILCYKNVSTIQVKNVSANAIVNMCNMF